MRIALEVFNPKSALLAKHAQHVVLIHFPIALFLAGVAFDMAAYFSNRKTTTGRLGGGPSILEAAAYANLVAAAVSVFPVVISGILAWRWQLEGQRLHGILLLHLVFGCCSGLLIAFVGWIHFRGRRRAQPHLPGYRLPLEFGAVIVVIATAHLGGFLSGVNLPIAS